MAKCLRILVVDDDEDNANSLGELFEMEGHHVTVAHSGEAAIEHYVGSSFDLAFMDVMMPGLNGVESFMEIRKLRPEAKVFMMTGYSVEQLLQQAMEHGAMGVLSKPINLDKLLKTVDEVRPSGIVLITEENPAFGAQLKQMMDDAGFACDLLKRETDLVLDDNAFAIIDIGKPLINCVDVYRQLRLQGHVKPAIILTKPGQQGGDAHEALRDIAVTGILNKPFDPLQLLQRLDFLAA
jgi:two-component system, NtrC family, response regulator HydG